MGRRSPGTGVGVLDRPWPGRPGSESEEPEVLARNSGVAAAAARRGDGAGSSYRAEHSMTALALTAAISTLVLLYVYVGYPLLLRLLVAIRGPRQIRRADITPRLTLIISA